MARFGWKLPKGPEAKPCAGAEQDSPPPAPGRRRVRRVVLFWLHIAVLVLAVLGLAYLNHALGLDRLLSSPWRALRGVWLPLLFLLAYLLCWLSWWAIRQLGPERVPNDFSDLEQAWQSAKRQLADHGIDLRSTPLFLILGEPEGGPEPLFNASRWPFQVRYSGPGKTPSLHVYGNREAVFVACGSSSLLAATSRSYAQAGREASPPTAVCLPADLAPDSPGGAPNGPVSAASPEEAAPEEDSTLAPAPPTALPTAAMAAGQESRTAAAPRASIVGDEPSDSILASSDAWPIRDVEQRERLAARLRAICALIANDRQPLVPVNGVLTVLPLFATDDARSAKAVADACRSDLQLAREALEVECPNMAVVCDFQKVPGFDELVAAYPDSPTQQWVLGRTFPLVPDIEDARWPSMIAKGLRWLSDSLWPSAVYPVMQAGAADWREDDPDMEANRRRFRLLEEGYQRLHAAADLAVRAFQTSAPERPLLGGFAVAATGIDETREQGFVAGVFRWLVEAQDHVAWSDEAIRDDLVCRRWSLFGWLGMTVLLASLLALAGRFWS